MRAGARNHDCADPQAAALIKRGYVERVGNAYRVTDRVNIPDLQGKLERRIDLIVETAAELSRLRTGKV